MADHSEPSGGPDGRRASRYVWPIAETVVGTVMGVVALVPIANAWAPSLPFDDSYIAFAYALHFATGHGLTLSVGAKPVEAYSDPLWVLILATGKWLGFTIPTWSNIANIVLVAGLAGTTMRMVRRLTPTAPLWTAAGAGVVIAMLPAVAYYAVAGLETLLFAVLFNLTVLWFLTDCERRQPLSPATSAFCLLLALTRPEGALLWATAWALTWWWSPDVRRQLKAAAWFLVPGGLIELGRLLYFHQLLPNSIVAKSGLPLSATADLAKTASLHFWHHYFPILIVGLVVVVACLARQALPRNFRPLAVIVVVMSAVEVVTSSGDGYPYERYLFVVLPVILAMAVAVVCQVGWPSPGRPVTHVASGRQGLFRWVSMSCVLILLGASLWAAFSTREWQATTSNDLNLSRGISHLHSLFSPDTLSKHSGRYHFSLAALLNRTQPPGSEIAMDEIGAVAYYTHMHVVDLYGLADTRISHKPGVPGDRAAPNYVFSQHPRDIALGFNRCLCLAFADYAAYAKDPRMLGYQLTDIIYNKSPPGALLYQRVEAAPTFMSLDREIPIDARRVTGLPMTLQQSLDVQELQSIVFHDGNPTPELRAGGVLAVRTDFTTIAPGASVSIRVHPAAGGACTVHLIGLSPGSGVPQHLSAFVERLKGQELASTSLALGTGPEIETSLLTFSAGDQDPLNLTVSGTSQAEWAEPFTTCQSA
jgi:hypothetical protein